MSIRRENRHALDVIFSRISHSHYWVNLFIPKKWNFIEKKPFHEDLDYKYLICIDGWVSGWVRPQLILKSNSVPLFVESNF
jgi:hypothetical protein